MKNWIVAGGDGVVAVLCKETLSRVRLDKSPHFVKMSLPTSVYYSFFCKCLKEGNPYAIYVDSIRRGFCELDLPTAIKNLNDIQNEFSLAKLAYIMLGTCGGVDVGHVLTEFGKDHVNLGEVARMTQKLIEDVNAIGPRRCGSFAKTWYIEQYPECWQEHEIFGEYNGERCSRCIYYYLSRDICMLS